VTIFRTAPVLRILCCLQLLAFTTGCASYRPAALPSGTEAPADDAAPVVQAGSDVRVVLVDGEEIRGEVVRLSPDELVIGSNGNYGYEERAVARTAIAALEVEHYPKAASVALSGVGLLLVGFVALMVYVGTTIDWGGG